jgi:hypothetical protein
LIDQQTLQGYLKELQEDLTPDQLQRVTALMLTDPVKFHEYFQIAHSQLQGSKKDSTKSAATKPEPTISKTEPPRKQITEFDDVTLFLLTLPHHLLEGKEEKVKS